MTTTHRILSRPLSRHPFNALYSVNTPIQYSLFCQHTFSIPSTLSTPLSILSILSTHLFNALYTVNTHLQYSLLCQHTLTILSALSTHPFNALYSVNTPFQYSLFCQHTLSILSILSTHLFNALYSVNTPFHTQYAPEDVPEARFSYDISPMAVVIKKKGTCRRTTLVTSHHITHLFR